MVTFSMTVSDPVHKFQGYDILQCPVTWKWYKIRAIHTMAN